MDKLNLEACPFCGTEPKIQRESLGERYAYANVIKVQCPSCGAAISATGDTSKPGYADNSTTEKRAVGAWNRRDSSVSEGELSDAVIAGIMGWRGPGAYTAASLRKIRDVIAADRESRRASPAAAVPEGALPPLPSWIQNASFGIHDWREVAQAMQAYARAAVEADRAQRQAMINAEAAAWARENGLNVPAAWDGAVTDYGSPVDNSADRAQQGEPAGYVRESSLARLGSTDSTATIWSKPHASDYVPVYLAATKAAAPDKTKEKPR